MKQKPAKKSTNRLRIFATIVGALVLASLLFWFQDKWLWKTYKGKTILTMAYPSNWTIFHNDTKQISDANGLFVFGISNKKSIINNPQSNINITIYKYEKIGINQSAYAIAKRHADVATSYIYEFRVGGKKALGVINRGSNSTSFYSFPETDKYIYKINENYTNSNYPSINPFDQIVVSRILNSLRLE